MNQKMVEANKNKKQRTEELIKQHTSKSSQENPNRILTFLKKILLMIKSKDRLQKIITKFKNEVVRLKNLNAELSKENKLLNRDFDRISKENLKLSSNNQKILAENDELSIELNSIKNENRQLKKQIRTLERQKNQNSNIESADKEELHLKDNSSKLKKPLGGKIGNAYKKLWNRQNEETLLIRKPYYKNSSTENIVCSHPNKKPKKRKKVQKSDYAEKFITDTVTALHLHDSQIKQLKETRIFIVGGFPNDTLKKILPIFDDRSEFANLPDHGKTGLVKMINKVKSILSDDSFDFVIVSPYISHGLLYSIRNFENYKEKSVTVPKNTTKYYPIEKILKKLSLI